MTRLIYKLSTSLVKTRLNEAHILAHMNLLKAHHVESYAHSVRVGLLSVDLGYENGLDQMCLLADSALLHDIGKVRISLEVLAKPGPLNKEELEIMQTHPRKGFDLLNEPIYETIRKVGIGHHEYQSPAYPRQERREEKGEIESLKQIIAAADKYDALMSKRIYKPALPKDIVEKLLRSQFTGDQRHVDQVLRRS